MRVELRDADAANGKDYRYLVLAWETPEEEDFLSKLRDLWNAHERLVDSTRTALGMAAYRFDISLTRSQRKEQAQKR